MYETYRSKYEEYIFRFEVKKSKIITKINCNELWSGNKVKQDIKQFLFRIIFKKYFLVLISNSSHHYYLAN